MYKILDSSLSFRGRILRTWVVRCVTGSRVVAILIPVLYVVDDEGPTSALTRFTPDDVCPDSTPLGDDPDYVLTRGRRPDVNGGDCTGTREVTVPLPHWLRRGRWTCKTTTESLVGRGRMVLTMDVYGSPPDSCSGGWVETGWESGTVSCVQTSCPLTGRVRL